MDLTNGIGADSVLECVGTQESMMQAIHAARPGGYVGYVGVLHGVELNGEELFFEHVHLHGAPAPVRRFLPQLIDLAWKGRSNRERSSTLRCLSNKWRRATAQWTNAAPSKRCCVRNALSYGRNTNCASASSMGISPFPSSHSPRPSVSRSASRRTWT
jgi:threonine dehydrogenase-like Zn-dependent dehydrogenase